MKSIYLSLPSDKQEISQYVLATVTSSAGSTPQNPGSSALFNSSGLIAGTVGGGILEAKVQEIALKLAGTGRSDHHFFKLSNEAEGGEDALCGGNISVLIDADLKAGLGEFNCLKEELALHNRGVLFTKVTTLEDGNFRIVRHFVKENSDQDVINGLEDWAGKAVAEVFAADKGYDFREIISPLMEEKGSVRYFLDPVFPPSRLLIAGAGHIGRALARIGQMLDFEITVADDRAEFANHENIPWADHFLVDRIGHSIEKFVKGKDLFIVIVTRGHRDDSVALRACIGSDTAYIGMIGSKNKIALMKSEFITKGWATEDQWNCIYAPIGLDISSKTVEEIAVSIAAQLVKIRNQPDSSRRVF